MGNLVYFSSADRDMEAFLDHDAFDRSLLHNVLFQKGIIVPDIFFVISEGVETHLRKSSRTLFEACIEKGVIVPSFRDASAVSFPEGLSLIRRQGIVGVRETAERTMTRLQGAADKSAKFSPFVPSVHLASSFDERVTVLQAKQPPDIGPDLASTMLRSELQKYWILTEKWRYASIDEARETTRKNFGDTGLRRGEIHRAVARSLAPGAEPVIQDLQALFKRYPDRPELRVFFQWISEIYEYNHALGMESLPNFPAFNDFSIVSLGLSQLSKGIETPPDYWPTINETVELPPLAKLKEMNPDELLAIREQEGAEYLADLAAWQADPKNSAKEKYVRESLHRYAKAIVRRSSNEIRGPVNAILSHLPPAARYLAPHMLVGATGWVTTHNPAAAAASSALVALGQCGYAVYAWLRQSPSTQPVALKANQDVPGTEVNILDAEKPGTSMISTSQGKTEVSLRSGTPEAFDSKK